MLLQETHFRTGSTPAINSRFYHTWHHSTNPPAKSRGASIALQKSFHPEVLDSLIDPNGRYVFLKLKYQSSIFTVAVYSPNQEQGRFLSAVLDRLITFGGPCFVLCGDFNMSLSPFVDTSLGKSSTAHSALMHIKSLLHSAQ